MRYFTITIFALLIGSFASQAQCTDLFFSEYIEGASSNKALEIYNPTAAPIDLSDYVLYRYNNGSTIATDSLFPVGVLAAGDVFVIGNSSADIAILTQSDTLHTLTFFNGDDAMTLVKISTGAVIDGFGEIGVDPGASWPVGTGATANFTLIRSVNIQQGQANWAVGQTQWDVFPIDMFDSLGAHSMIACGTPCTNTSSTITPTACETYTAPDGMVYTATGSYTAIIPNAQGCDSTITVNLTINNATSSTITDSACDSVVVNGTTYTFSGTYTQTLTNAAGCDSIITITLDITATPSMPVVQGTISYCEGETPTALTVGAVATDSLIISGVLDATLTGGLPKVVEFYALENIADLSAYGFGSANNGGGTDGEEFTFPAIPVTAGTYIHVGTDSANFFSFLGFYPDFTDASAGNVNGDDAIELFHNGVVIDVFGDINVDGTGQPWEYLDGWAYRATNAAPNGGTFIIGEWIFSGINVLDGAVDNASSNAPFPYDTYSFTPQTSTIEWFDDATLLNLVGTGAAFTPTATSGITTYYVTATNNGTSNCTSAATLVDVTFNTLPVVSANASFTTVCEGEDVTLTGSGASVYIWDNGVVNGTAFAATTTTTYMVTGTDVNGCENVDTVTVTVNPAPNVSMTPLPTVCVNAANFTLDQGSPAGGTYSGTGVSGTDDFDPATAGVGVYTITYTYADSIGCSASATADIEVDGCINVDEIVGSEIVLYPNPATTIVTVQSDATITEMVLLNLSGVVVAKTNENQISVADLASGMYVLSITNEFGTMSKTFVKN